jgi:hypothetical protein
LVSDSVLETIELEPELDGLTGLMVDQFKQANKLNRSVDL